MAHYELYICLTKATYESAVPSVLQPKLGWKTFASDLPTNSNTVAEIKTWMDSKSLSYSSSDLKADLLDIVALGNSLSYPNNSVLTKTEAQTLVKGNLFSE